MAEQDKDSQKENLKNSVLDEIFANDPFGLLEVKAKAKARTADERLVEKFREITDFVTTHGKEPEANMANISEYQLHARLKGLRENEEQRLSLADEDTHGLLQVEPEPVIEKEINSLDDIFADDSFGLLGDAESSSLFEFKHTPKQEDRQETDFVARRKPCKDFDKYKEKFKEVQRDLKEGKRTLTEFSEKELREDNYFVHNGVLLLLEKIINPHQDQAGKIDGRTRIIFENGTESNMKLRSLGKNLFQNGQGISSNLKQQNEDFIKTFSDINEDDEATGYIYILKSKSKKEDIRTIQNLYKIGYSSTDVATRIKDAAKDPTYLMADVEHVASWKTFNMNPQTFENLIHRFFGAACLDMVVHDEKGKEHKPQEWFIVPIEVIREAVQLIISEDIVHYRYDDIKEQIIPR